MSCEMNIFNATTNDNRNSQCEAIYAIMSNIHPNLAGNDNNGSS